MNKKKTYRLYILSFLIPALIFSLILAIFKAAPFGENAFFVNDMGGQYISFFSYFKQMLAGDKSSLFTFAKLIGGDLQGLIAYYLISPFNVILLFFNTANMASAVVVMMILKIGTAGITSYAYFSRYSSNGILKLIFSTAYSLMAYNIIYSQNIMWLDGVIILPIIALGIDLLIEKKKVLPYILALVYGIITNYYIGYMLCIFSVIYFVYKIILQNEIKIAQIVKKLADFTFASIISGGLCAWLLLPTLKSLSGTSKQSLGLEEIISLSTNLRFSEIISHIFFPKATMQTLETKMPNLYVGLFVLCMALLLFISRRVKLKEKIISLLILLFMLFSTYFVTPNLVWHGFAHPVCFPFRFSFIFSFFIVLFAFRFLTNSPFESKNIWLATLLILNTGTIFAFGYINVAALKLTPDTFKPFYETVSPLIEKVKAEQGKSFYRIEKDFLYSQNDAMTFGYNGLSHFSSGEKLFTRTLPRIMGYTIKEGLGTYNTGSSLAADSFWGIKYLLSRQDGKYGLEDYSKDNGIKIYENPYALPIAVESDRAIVDLKAKDLSIMDATGEIMSVVLKDDYSFAKEQNKQDVKLENISKSTENGRERYKIISEEESALIKYNFKAEHQGNLYILMDSYNYPGVDVRINGESIGEYLTSGNFGIEYLLKTNIGEDINVEIEVFSELEINFIKFFYEDDIALQKMKAAVEAQKIETGDFTDSRFTLSGKIEKDNSGILVMLPNQEGWQVKSANKKVASTTALGTFMYIPLEKGEFNLFVAYTPPGFYLGILISAISLVALTGYGYIKKAKKQ